MGTLICNDGDLSPELESVKDKTLAVYYGNMRSPKAKYATVRQKLNIVHRICRCVWHYKCGGYP
eukprot:11877512-Karenia_brevis.AAC.1